jgi:hypothetical protein
MSVRKAEAYRATARRVRELANTVRSADEQQTLLDIADRYERIAERSTLALDEFQADLHSD